MAYSADKHLNHIARTIAAESIAVPLQVREFLAHFGATQRKSKVCWEIDQWLARNGLLTDPDYKSTRLEEPILLRAGQLPGKAPALDQVERLRMLKAANRAPKFVTRNDSLSRAITIMAQHNFSQLPVMAKQEARKVDGMISWKSIGIARATQASTDTVAACMEDEVEILEADFPLLEAIPIVIEHQVVLVRDKSKGNIISGLVTLTDIAGDYHQKAGPFRVLGQIEFCIRELIGDKFTVDELQAVKFTGDERKIESVADLSFSEYIQLMRKGDNWERLGLHLDKDEFTRNLDQIREIRNEVMHFSSEPLLPEEYDQLENTLQFLKQLVGQD